MFDVFQVEYWNGIQYVLRIARCLCPGCYLVFDRYDNGAECLVMEGVKTLLTQAETVRVLDAVC